MATTYDKKKDPAPSGSTSDENNKPAENSAEGASLDEPPATQENSAKMPHISTWWATEVFCADDIDSSRSAPAITIGLHGTAPRCPDCGHILSGKAAQSFFQGERCVCPACGRWFTARTGTFLQGSQLSYSQVFLMAVLIDFMQNGLTPARIAQAVGVSADTVRIWIKRFKVFDGE